jgi:hypothetical protein
MLGSQLLSTGEQGTFSFQLHPHLTLSPSLEQYREIRKGLTGLITVQVSDRIYYRMQVIRLST